MIESLIPTKDNTFIAMAFVLSCLSKDAETKMGCLIVNDKNHIIGGGYNSFPSGCPDHELPNTRPEKYPFMIHSESNGLSFCTMKPVGATIYVTGQPCIECIKRMWQEEVACVKYCDRLANCVSSENIEERQRIIDMCPVNFVEFIPNLDFIVDLLLKIEELGYVSSEAMNKIRS